MSHSAEMRATRLGDKQVYINLAGSQLVKVPA